MYIKKFIQNIIFFVLFLLNASFVCDKKFESLILKRKIFTIREKFSSKFLREFWIKNFLIKKKCRRKKPVCQCIKIL